MFKVVKPPVVIDHRQSTGESRPEIVHNTGKTDSRQWSVKKNADDLAYKHLKQHRDELLESEVLYKKTIKKLEKEKAELINIYEPTYKENKVLKSVLQHGPDAVKIKKLQRDERECREEVETLKYENKKLTEQMKEMIKNNTKARDFILEKNWRDVLTDGKNKKDKNDTKPTQGPFPGKEAERRNNIIEKENIYEEDDYDLQLDTVEKEVQILVNNVKHIKKQKAKLDCAILMGKGAIVRNNVLESAISDKLEENLKTIKNDLTGRKRTLEQKKKELDKRKKEAVNGENQEQIQQTTSEFQSKNYKTSETQTDKCESEELSSFSKQLESFKKKKNHQAVQTDFSNTEHVPETNIETEKYQNKNKKWKLQKADKEPSQDTSARKIRIDYAKKLVVRRHPGENSVENPLISPEEAKERCYQKEKKSETNKREQQKVPIKKSQSVENLSYSEKLPLISKDIKSDLPMDLVRFKPKKNERLNYQPKAIDSEKKIMVHETESIPVSKNKYTKLKKKTKNLNKDNTEEEVRLEKKQKTKETGTKHFRSKSTQTDIPLVIHHGDNNRDAKKCVANFGNGQKLLKSHSTSRKEHYKKRSIPKTSTPKYYYLQEVSDWCESRIGQFKEDSNREYKVVVNVPRETKASSNTKSFERQSTTLEEGKHCNMEDTTENKSTKSSKSKYDLINTFERIYGDGELSEDGISKLETGTTIFKEPMLKPQTSIRKDVFRNTQDSWESDFNGGYRSDPFERYNHGPEPVRQHRIELIANTSKERFENDSFELKWRSEFKTYSEIKEESVLSKNS